MTMRTWYITFDENKATFSESSYKRAFGPLFYATIEGETAEKALEKFQNRPGLRPGDKLNPFYLKVTGKKP